MIIKVSEWRTGCVCGWTKEGIAESQLKAIEKAKVELDQHLHEAHGWSLSRLEADAGIVGAPEYRA